MKKIDFLNKMYSEDIIKFIYEKNLFILMNKNGNIYTTFD